MFAFVELLALLALVLMLTYQRIVIRDLRRDAERREDHLTYLEEELRDARLFCRPTKEEIIRKLEQPEVSRSLIKSIEGGRR